MLSQGLITVVDDSHGIGAGATWGEIVNTKADVLVGTFGKALVLMGDL